MMILSPMATGNGAYIVHKTLESQIPYYQVVSYNPYRTFFPPSLPLIGRSTPADLIHTTPDYAIFHKRKDIPLILTFHNYVLDRFMHDYSSVLQKVHYRTNLKLFTKLAMFNAPVVTAVSQFTADLVTRELRLSRAVRVIYNGIDHTLFVPSKSPKAKGKRISTLFCGNLTLRKGAQWLIPIANKLKRNIFITYTSGLRTKKGQINHSRLKNLGSISHQQMPAIYNDSDILLFPSVREGFGLAAAEAMACGLPVVATDCSSLPELIHHGMGGFLCPLGDVDTFAEKINLLAESPQLRREMGEYNRARVEKMFTLDKMVHQYKELFEEILAEGQHQP